MGIPSHRLYILLIRKYLYFRYQKCLVIAFPDENLGSVSHFLERLVMVNRTSGSENISKICLKWFSVKCESAPLGTWFKPRYIDDGSVELLTPQNSWMLPLNTALQAVVLQLKRTLNLCWVICSFSQSSYKIMVQWKMARYLKVRFLLEMSYHFSRHSCHDYGRKASWLAARRCFC